jgi:hypothetical protein
MTDNYVSLTWKQFDEEFKPIKNHFSHDPNQETFETYGEEVEFVKAQDNNKIWTWVQGDECDLLVNGFAFVNRLGYYITENPWDESKDYELIISTEVECECYKEDGYPDGEYGDENCNECEGSGRITHYAD